MAEAPPAFTADAGAPGGGPERVGGTRPTQKAADAAAVEGEALRRRQLRAALCHGSDRSWRDRYRAWPSLIAGVVAVVLICAGIGVFGAFQKQQRLDREEKRKRQEQERRATQQPTYPTSQPTNTSQISSPPPSSSLPPSSTKPAGGKKATKSPRR